MHQAFGTVVVVVCVVAIVVALFALARSNKTWSEHGKGGLLLERDLPRGPVPSGGTGTAERDSEIRELLQARNARRARRGEEPLDVEAELARLTAAPGHSAPGRSAPGHSPPGHSAPGHAPDRADAAPAIDPDLREEVRQLVMARNARRIRAGKSPLDVESELERELRRLGEL